MLEIADVRKRVRRLIEDSQHTAQARRDRAASAEALGTSVLAAVVAPVVKTVAAALKAEGYSFRVSTPAGAVRLAAEASSDDFVEVVLDTQRDPPGLIVRVSRVWGRRVLVDEQVVCEDAAIADLTDDRALECLLHALPPFVER